MNHKERFRCTWKVTETKSSLQLHDAEIALCERWSNICSFQGRALIFSQCCTKFWNILKFDIFRYRFSALPLIMVNAAGMMESTEAGFLVQPCSQFTEPFLKCVSSIISILIIFSSQGYAVEIMHFCFSTPATATEADAAKPASEQDLSGRAACCCSVASFANAARAAQEPYDHKWVSGATDHQGHHGMTQLLVSWDHMYVMFIFKDRCKCSRRVVFKQGWWKQM